MTLKQCDFTSTDAADNPKLELQVKPTYARINRYNVSGDIDTVWLPEPDLRTLYGWLTDLFKMSDTP